jgi:pilus assembly protein Flp/PilA
LDSCCLQLRAKDKVNKQANIINFVKPTKAPCFPFCLLEISQPIRCIIYQTWGQPGEEKKISEASHAGILLMSKMRANIMDRIVQYVKQFLSEEEGVTAIEYGLIAALIAVAIIGGVQLIGGNLQSAFTFIAGKITTG